MRTQTLKRRTSSTTRTASRFKNRSISRSSSRSASGKRKVYHLLRHNGHWVIKAKGSTRVLRNFKTKEEALDQGRKIAKSNKLGQLVVHRKDNRIQTEFTYGNDPRSSKG